MVRGLVLALVLAQHYSAYAFGVDLHLHNLALTFARQPERSLTFANALNAAPRPYPIPL
jgi:hypothetical protein